MLQPPNLKTLAIQLNIQHKYVQCYQWNGLSHVNCYKSFMQLTYQHCAGASQNVFILNQKRTLLVEADFRTHRVDKNNNLNIQHIFICVTISTSVKFPLCSTQQISTIPCYDSFYAVMRCVLNLQSLTLTTM